MFKEGTKLVCIGDGDWACPFCQSECTSKLPVNGEIYISDGPNEKDSKYIYLKGFYEIDCIGERDSFYYESFREVDETFSENLLSEIEEEINQEQLVEV